MAMQEDHIISEEKACSDYKAKFVTISGVTNPERLLEIAIIFSGDYSTLNRRTRFFRS